MLNTFIDNDIIYNDNKTNDIIDKLLNEKNNVNTLKHLINTEVSYDVISNFIADNLYLLNKSELRARLNNCRYEIEQFINNKNIILNIKNNDILQDKLRLISENNDKIEINNNNRGDFNNVTVSSIDEINSSENRINFDNSK